MTKSPWAGNDTDVAMVKKKLITGLRDSVDDLLSHWIRDQCGKGLPPEIAYSTIIGALYMNMINATVAMAKEDQRGAALEDMRSLVNGATDVAKALLARPKKKAKKR